MKIWLVEGEHHIVPGLVRKAFATKELADVEAAELVNIVTGFNAGESVMQATPANWIIALEDFVDCGDLSPEEEPWVWIGELEVAS